MTINPSNLPSNRAFGTLFIGVFAILACYGYFRGWDFSFVLAYLICLATFLLLTLFMPKSLAPFNRAWYQLGLLMGKVVSPIVLGVLFFLVITPVALVMRLVGRDALKIRKQNVNTYWVDRLPPGPEPESFKEQF